MQNVYLSAGRNILKRNRIKLDVIITDASNRITYNILRSLARRGLRVGVGSDSHSGMAVFSRYSSTTFTHPSYERDEKLFVSSVKQVLSAYLPSVYIPGGEDIFFVAEHRDMLGDLPVRIAIASADTLRLLDNKNDVLELAKSLDIPIPETITPSDEKEIKAFSHEHGDPVMLKISRSSASHGVFYLYKDRLFTSLNKLLNANGIGYGDFIVQEFVRGTGYGVSMLFNQGLLRAKFVHKRLRERSSTGGPSTLRESVRHSRLEEYGERLLQHVGYHGVAMVEFICNKRSQKAWLLEVNPRWWGSLALPIHAGVDFPYLLYRMAMDGDILPVLDYKTGITVRWLLGDLLALKNESKSTRRLPSLRDIFAKVDGYDDFYLDDLLPLPAELLLHLRKTIKAKF